MQLQEWLPSKLGQDIWNKKYKYADIDAGVDEDFDQWLERVTAGDERLKALFIEKKFMFGGRILSNRGIPQRYGKKGTYSNCYVVAHPTDSLESIFDFAYKLARTYSYGGGSGGDISYLCPTNAKVNNSAEKSTGAVSFMELFNLVTALISQKGRRGALMLMMVCNHPDIFEFIKSKSDLNKVTKANISVKFTAEFIEAIKADADWELKFTRPETGEVICNTIKANDLINEIAFQAWDIGDPGCLFWDNICNWNLLSNDEEFEFDGTNPCGEEPLPAGGSCLLSAFNLSAYVVDAFTPGAKFDLANFSNDVKYAVIKNNEILDEGLPLHPLPEQRESVAKWRQIGTGIMGLADAFIKMGIKYGSQRSIDLVEQIGSAMINSALQQSALLAKEYGTYPAYKKEAVMNSAFFKAVANAKTIKLVEQYGLYNSQLLTIAPTGTLSTMIGVSGGLEPLFAISYMRKTETLHDEERLYPVYSPIIADLMGGEEIIDRKMPEYVITAMNLNWHERIDVQAAFQKYIDASISSTVNLPKHTTAEEIRALYLEAHDKGCKGITVFRTGCRKEGIFTIEVQGEIMEALGRGEILDVSDELIGLKRKLITGCGSLHCLAYFDRQTGELMETYLSKGSAGGCNSFMIFTSRLISLCARGGISAEDIVDQSQSVPVCPSYAVRRAVKNDTSAGTSCPSAVGAAIVSMEEEIKGIINKIETLTHTKAQPEKASAEKCPNCEKPIDHIGGCVSCSHCGWSQCG